jgi:hypothetical protein
MSRTRQVAKKLSTVFLRHAVTAINNYLSRATPAGPTPPTKSAPTETEPARASDESESRRQLAITRVAGGSVLVTTVALGGWVLAGGQALASKLSTWGVIGIIGFLFALGTALVWAEIVQRQRLHKEIERYLFLYALVLPALALSTGIVAWLRLPPSIATQLNQSLPTGYVVSTNQIVTFQPGQSVRLVLINPEADESTDSSELRIYTAADYGRLDLLFDFKPEVLEPAIPGLSPRGPGSVQSPGFRLAVVAPANLEQTFGQQSLVDISEPQLPTLGVIPMLLAETASSRFTLEPLLSPTGIGGNEAAFLSTACFGPDDWARLVRKYLYETPSTVSDAVPNPGGHIDMKAFSVLGYAVGQMTSDSPGTLEVAAGYVVRGGDPPTPMTMQVLLWTIDLLPNPPVARTFGGLPEFVHLQPSAPSKQVTASLRQAATEQLVPANTNGEPVECP